MSHIKDRLSDYHDWIQDIVNRYELITARDVLEMIEQLQDDLEQDEKENGCIPVKHHPVSEKERAEEYLSKDIQYMLDCEMEVVDNPELLQEE